VLVAKLEGTEAVIGLLGKLLVGNSTDAELDDDGTSPVERGGEDRLYAGYEYGAGAVSDEVTGVEVAGADDVELGAVTGLFGKLLVGVSDDAELEDTELLVGVSNGAELDDELSPVERGGEDGV